MLSMVILTLNRTQASVKQLRMILQGKKPWWDEDVIGGWLAVMDKVH